MLDFETLKRSARPNNYLLSDTTGGLKPDGPATVFSAQVMRVQAALRAVLEAETRIKTIYASAGDKQWAFVQRSAMFGFPDDITIEFLAIEEGTGAKLSIYSRARVGYSDMGVNRKRVRRWLDAIQSQIDNQA